MFELEITGKESVKFGSSAVAENAFGNVAADGLEAWLYLDDSVLAYTSGDGVVIDRNARTVNLSIPLWVGAEQK